LVTGAGLGIGRACALALANAGADIALGLRDVQTGSDLAGEIETMRRGRFASKWMARISIKSISWYLPYFCPPN
jgi:NAD(P)-dependent dehydrogenase (short-subunit alcohol dehydrogenase family)